MALRVVVHIAGINPQKEGRTCAKCSTINRLLRAQHLQEKIAKCIQSSVHLAGEVSTGPLIKSAVVISCVNRALPWDGDFFDRNSPGRRFIEPI